MSPLAKWAGIAVVASGLAGVAGAAQAMPLGAPGASDENVQKVVRVCRPDGYCFNKYNGAPMRNPAYRPRPYGYYDGPPRRWRGPPPGYGGYRY